MSILLMEVKAFGTKMWLSVFGVAIKSRWYPRYHKKIVVTQQADELTPIP